MHGVVGYRGVNEFDSMLGGILQSTVSFVEGIGSDDDELNHKVVESQKVEETVDCSV